MSAATLLLTTLEPEVSIKYSTEGGNEVTIEDATEPDISPLLPEQTELEDEQRAMKDKAETAETERINLRERKMPTTHSEMTLEDIEHLIQQRVAEALAARAVNSNNGNETTKGNENRNEVKNHNEVNGGLGGVTPVTQACTYKDFLNCQPRNFGGTEGVVVKFATCTMVDGALTWWNSQVHIVGIDEAYGISWKDLMKLMIEGRRIKLRVRAYAARNAKNKRKFENNPLDNRTGNNEARRRAYALGGGEVNPDSNVVTSTFLLNNRYASILFDSSADRSFVSTTFSSFIDVVPTSFDGIIGMEWLSKYHAIINCNKKIVHIPYGNEVLTIQGDGSDGGSNSRLNIISCTKTQKYIERGCHVFLAQITKKKAKDKSKEKRLEDVPIAWDFLEVFPKGLRRVPPA
ncbi:putative reverse transcriptase domain-containing protein [Tanacetum coccineum]